MDIEERITAGEWEIVFEDEDDIDIGVPCNDGIGYYPVCTVNMDNDGFANTAIIMAAPDMYRALKMVEPIIDETAIDEETAKSIREALAKARIEII